MANNPSVRKGFAQINGVELYYEVAGEGYPFVMLHGHLLDSRQWDEQFEFFARKYNVVRFDARGFGESGQSAEPFAYHEDLRGIMDFLGLERAHLMGCSGGGATIINMALVYPQRVSAMVLVGTALEGFRFQTAGPPPPLLLELNQALKEGETDKAVELSLRLFTDGIGRTPEQVSHTARERTRAMTAKLYARPKNEATVQSLEPPAIDQLAEINAPTLLVVGANDNPVIHQIADLIAAQVKGARKVVIADAGHHPNMEHPEEFNQIVEEFLATFDA